MRHIFRIRQLRNLLFFSIFLGLPSAMSKPSTPDRAQAQITPYLNRFVKGSSSDQSNSAAIIASISTMSDQDREDVISQLNAVQFSREVETGRAVSLMRATRQSSEASTIHPGTPTPARAASVNSRFTRVNIQRVESKQKNRVC